MKQQFLPSADCRAVGSLLSALCHVCPEMQVGCFGKSELGSPLHFARIGHGKRKLLISAGHHGNEWISTQLLMLFALRLCEGAVCGAASKTVFEHATLFLVPLVNPDGTAIAQGTLCHGNAYDCARLIAGDFPQTPFPSGWKANALGVDLNLQYPAEWELAREIKFAQGFDRPAPRDYVGSAPLAAAESRALYDFTRKVSPDTVIALHSQGEVIYWQYGRHNPVGARELGERLGAVSGYALEETPFESAHAGYKDWFIAEFDRPGYTVELGHGENPLPRCQLPEIYGKAAPLLLQAALWNG